MNSNLIKMSFKKVSTVFIIAVLIFSSLPFTQTRAQAAGECNETDYSMQNVMFYYPCDTCSASQSVLAGATNEEKVFNWLTSEQHGFNAAQAAGMMGNINTESSFNPFRMQTTYSSSGIEAVLPIGSHSEYNKAFGLVQWDGGRRQQILTKIAEKFPSYKEDINAYGKSADGYKDAGEKNDQYLTFALEFLNLELSEGYKGVYDEIRAQPNTEEGVENSAEIWNRKYEVSGDYSRDRHTKGKEYFAQFKDKTSATASGSDCSSQPSGEVVWYSQTDPRWASIGYAGGTIGEIGCGPSSMAIILASLVDKSITPPDVAAVAGAQNGGTDSHANLIAGVTAKWTNVSIQTINFNAAVEFVKSGKGYVWIGGAGTPPFTEGGHMVAMTGVTSDGQITIADPAGEMTGHQKVSNYPAAQIQATGNFFYGVSVK